MEKRTAIALGSFDGLHLGHTAVLQSALQCAGDGVQPLALLFDRHPLSVLSGHAPPMLLQNVLRDELLRKMGFAVQTVAFESIRDLEPEAFVADILRDRLHASAVCCGYNYRFGREGRGDAALLRALCDACGIEVRVSPPVLCRGEPVSSTRIRCALEDGDVSSAAAMLGRPFAYTGEVIHGSENGRALGYPTANQIYPGVLAVPKRGVYASDVLLGGKTFRAITNIGIRPTVQDDTLLSETHILGADDDLYGQTVTVYLHRFIRPERKFNSLPDVFRQVRFDIRTAYPDILDDGGMAT